MAIQQVDLVGDVRPVVTPAATATMAQAVRDGTISILDIMSRVDERAKAKEKMDIATANQVTAETTDPQLIQAYRSQQLLAGDQAQQNRDLLPLARRATEEKLNADIRSGQIARYGLKEKLEALNNVGFAPAPDPSKGITPEYALEVNKKFGTMLRWQKKKADGVFNSALFDAGEIVTPAGTFSGPMDKITGAPGDPKQISQWRKDAAMTLPEFLLAEPPGGVVDAVSQPIAQPTAQAAPVIQAAQPVAQAAAPVIQPVAQAAAPVIQPAQAGIPPGFIQVKPAPIIPEKANLLKREDDLQRELLDLDATTKRIADTKTLAVPGIVGPGQFGWIQNAHQIAAAFGITDWNPLYEKRDKPTEREIYTAQDRLNNAIADEIATYVQTWKGAISDRELKFFKEGRPRVNSTPEAWKIYLDRWDAKNEEIKKIVAGQLSSPDPTAGAANPKSAGLGTPGSLPPAPALSAAPSAAPMLRTFVEAEQQPSGKVFRDANGKLRRRL